MKPTTLFLYAFCLACALAPQMSCGQNQSGAGTNKWSDFTYTTKAYQREAVKLMIHEADSVASELKLEESLPIMEADINSPDVQPYRAAQLLKAVGFIATTNYNYDFAKGQKFSSLLWLDPGHLISRWKEDYRWNVSRVDTNTAYLLATQLLVAASIDVAALNRDCELHIDPTTMTNLYSFGIVGTTSDFVPIYSISWTKGGWGHGSVAYIRLFLPTKTLMELKVDDPRYINRHPLTFTNINALLSSP
jgi:hypothetical protein